MMKSHVFGCALALWLPAAFAQPASLANCRAISDAAQRLACYDAIADAVVPGLSPPGAARAETPARAPDDAAARFGLEARSEPQHDELRSHIVGPFAGWEPKAQLRLANGQVWMISDGSRAYYQLNEPKVRITRGALGSFFMEIEGVAKAPRVRRLR